MSVSIADTSSSDGETEGSIDPSLPAWSKTNNTPACYVYVLSHTLPAGVNSFRYLHEVKGGYKDKKSKFW